MSTYFLWNPDYAARGEVFHPLTRVLGLLWSEQLAPRERASARHRPGAFGEAVEDEQPGPGGSPSGGMPQKQARRGSCHPLFVRVGCVLECWRFVAQDSAMEGGRKENVRMMQNFG